MPFGRELQEERQKRKVSLESISESTKVSLRYLRALEAGHHEELPGGVFNKGIVRAYVLCLGLDETEWMTRFSAFSQSEGSPDWVEFAQNVKRNRAEINNRNQLRWLVIIIAFALLATIGWAAWHYGIAPRLHPHSATTTLSPPNPSC